MNSEIFLGGNTCKSTDMLYRKQGIFFKRAGEYTATIAGIPVLVLKSVPTAESVELAEEYNLKLICKAWPDQCEIFADY